MRKALTVIALVLACAGAATAPAATGWGGLTHDQAVAQAKKSAISIGVATGALTPADATALRRRMDATTPRAARVRCGTRQAWKVTWPKSDPLFVNRQQKLLFTCP